MTCERKSQTGSCIACAIADKRVVRAGEGAHSVVGHYTGVCGYAGDDEHDDGDDRCVPLVYFRMLLGELNELHDDVHVGASETESVAFRPDRSAVVGAVAVAMAAVNLPADVAGNEPVGVELVELEGIAD